MLSLCCLIIFISISGSAFIRPSTSTLPAATVGIVDPFGFSTAVLSIDSTIDYKCEASGLNETVHYKSGNEYKDTGTTAVPFTLSNDVWSKVDQITCRSAKTKNKEARVQFPLKFLACTPEAAWKNCNWTDPTLLTSPPTCFFNRAIAPAKAQCRNAASAPEISSACLLDKKTSATRLPPILACHDKKKQPSDFCTELLNSRLDTVVALRETTGDCGSQKYSVSANNETTLLTPYQLIPLDLAKSPAEIYIQGVQPITVSKCSLHLERIVKGAQQSQKIRQNCNLKPVKNDATLSLQNLIADSPWIGRLRLQDNEFILFADILLYDSSTIALGLKLTEKGAQLCCTAQTSWKSDGHLFDTRLTLSLHDGLQQRADETGSGVVEVCGEKRSWKSEEFRCEAKLTYLHTNGRVFIHVLKENNITKTITTTTTTTTTTSTTAPRTTSTKPPTTATPTSTKPPTAAPPVPPPPPPTSPPPPPPPVPPVTPLPLSTLSPENKTANATDDGSLSSTEPAGLRTTVSESPAAKQLNLPLILGLTVPVAVLLLTIVCCVGGYCMCFSKKSTVAEGSTRSRRPSTTDGSIKSKALTAMLKEKDNVIEVSECTAFVRQPVECENIKRLLAEFGAMNVAHNKHVSTLIADGKAGYLRGQSTAKGPILKSSAVLASDDKTVTVSSRIGRLSVTSSNNFDPLPGNYVSNLYGRKQYILAETPQEKNMQALNRCILRDKVKIIICIASDADMRNQRVYNYFNYKAFSNAKEGQAFNQSHYETSRIPVLSNRTLDIRSMAVGDDKSKELGPNHEFLHIHYKDWPERDSAGDFKHAIVLKAVLEKFGEFDPAIRNGKILMHCTDGTGRSAVLLAAFLCIDVVQSKQKTINVPGIVKHVRTYRLNAVRTSGQYETVFKTAGAENEIQKRLEVTKKEDKKNRASPRAGNLSSIASAGFADAVKQLEPFEDSVKQP